MRVRFGFVAMALELKNASPSKTITLTNFQKIMDEEAARHRVLRIAEENLANTLRILKYAYYEGIHLYRFSSKLIPLYGHAVTEDIRFMERLAKPFADIGEYVLSKGIRVGFHPDHFTLLNSPKQDITTRSIEDLHRHVDMLEAMGLDERAKLNIHVGGSYGDKAAAMERLIENWTHVAPGVQNRIIFENDDKTFTVSDTLWLCKKLGVPMTLDVHHHLCNHEDDEKLQDLLPDIFQTWQDTGLAPKVHFSSPKSEKEFRAHADFIDAQAVIEFLHLARPLDIALDIMVEAKAKDQAVIQLMKDLARYPTVKVLDGGSIEYRP